MLQLGCSSTGTFDHRPLRMGDVTLVSGCRIHITLAGPLASQIQLANRGWLSSARSCHQQNFDQRPLRVHRNPRLRSASRSSASQGAILQMKSARGSSSNQQRAFTAAHCLRVCKYLRPQSPCGLPPNFKTKLPATTVSANRQPR